MLRLNNILTKIILYTLLILFSMNVLLFWLDIYDNEDESTSKPENEPIIEGWWGRRRRQCRCGKDRRGKCRCCYGRNTNGWCMSWRQADEKLRKKRLVRLNKFNKLNGETKVDIQTKGSDGKSMNKKLDRLIQNQK